MANRGGTLFLEGTGKHAGPGRVGILSEAGQDWFSYHYYGLNAWAAHYGAYGPAKLALSNACMERGRLACLHKRLVRVLHVRVRRPGRKPAVPRPVENGATFAFDLARFGARSRWHRTVRLPAAGRRVRRTSTPPALKWRGGARPADSRFRDGGVAGVHADTGLGCQHPALGDRRWQRRAKPPSGRVRCRPIGGRTWP